MPILKPFQLLEINVISAQDLEPVSKKMKTYATAWVNPKRKLSTRVDSDGHINPTWNDKFVFRVDEEFLRQDTSAVQIEIYAVHWLRAPLVGTVRVLVGNLIPPIPTRPKHRNHIGMRFVALQVRRPSGRPQGILNIGVTLLDSSMRSMPLYTQLSASAVGYRDFMGEDENHLHQIQNMMSQKLANNSATGVKPILRRSKSERSERVTFESSVMNGSSVVAIPSKKGVLEKDGSILSISNVPPPLIVGKTYKQKASSVISGAELRKKPKGKASSVLSDSIMSKDSSIKAGKIKPKIGEKAKVTNQKPAPETFDPPAAKAVDEKSGTAPKGLGNIGPPTRGNSPKKTPPSMTMPGTAIGRPITKQNGHDQYGGPRVNSKFSYGGSIKPNSLWSDSEVGPSPSEVAAALAERRYPLEEERSSMLDGWSLDDCVEGLRSKLERWRTELPPIYDRGYGSCSIRSAGHPTRRNRGGENGLFSCFGNIFGYECQCICGKLPPAGRRGRYQSPSIVNPSFL